MHNQNPFLYDVLVLGAGGAGLMCASEAGRRGRRVLVLEHQERVGKKIAISGGGRCNFTNLGASPSNYLSEQPEFCKSALARYRPSDFIALVEKHGIAYHEKKLGQQFCTQSAREIIQMLLEECAAAHAEIRLNCQIHQVSRTDRFVVETSQGRFESQSLVIATGGLSFPKLGATGLGYQIAQRFGLKLTERRPGLVPLTLGADLARWEKLSGVSLPVRVRFGKHAFEENILFTHRGLSGPAILQISSYWQPGAPLQFNLLPDIASSAAFLQELRSKGGDLLHALGSRWPRRFTDAWCALHGPRRPLAQSSATELQSIASELEAWPLDFSGTEGYPKAEVTLGGVDTTELSSKTMEARRVQGLYFIGEVVDVTGWLGGYHFQWAWASGHAAGQFA